MADDVIVVDDDVSLDVGHALDNGNGRAPDISRKITACAACRKQKIKCHMSNGQPPCIRCSRRGLSCTINRSLQTILESDAAWKLATENKLKALEQSLAAVTQQLKHSSQPLALSPPPHSPKQIDPPSTADTGYTLSPAYSSRTRRHLLRNHWDVVMDPDSGPAEIPASVVHQLPDQHGGNGPDDDDPTQGDLISRGIVSVADAQRYFDIYTTRHDHFLYRILGDTPTLLQLRSSSPLLTAAVITVGALHAPSPDFEACYDDFLATAATLTFSRTNGPDEVRALLIGAFWLSGASWALSGTAVRLATELSLHRSLPHAIRGDRAHYLRARLYLHVYVCDHHFSIPYGRPPMTQPDESVQNASSILSCPHATEDDARLISQVEFWAINSRAFLAFGTDADRPLADGVLPNLRRLTVELDAARARWATAFARNSHVGNYPRKGVALHCHFARLYLASHALRGCGLGSGRAADRSPEGALEVDELAYAAVLSATSILRTVVNDAEFHDYLNGLSTYFDIMIAFAVVFLLKVSSKHSELVRIRVDDVARLVGDLVAVLKRITEAMHPQHLLVSVARGVEALLSSYIAESNQATSMATAHIPNIPTWTGPEPLDSAQLFGLEGGWNSLDLLNELDFLQDGSGNGSSTFNQSVY